MSRGSSRTPPASFILRGLGTQVQQAVALRPGLITVWIGNNDVLGAAVRGTAPDLVAILSPFHNFHHAPLLTPAHGGYVTPLGNVLIDPNAPPERRWVQVIPSGDVRITPCSPTAT